MDLKTQDAINFLRQQLRDESESIRKEIEYLRRFTEEFLTLRTEISKSCNALVEHKENLRVLDQQIADLKLAVKDLRDQANITFNIHVGLERKIDEIRKEKDKVEEKVTFANQRLGMLLPLNDNIAVFRDRLNAEIKKRDEQFVEFNKTIAHPFDAIVKSYLDTIEKLCSCEEISKKAFDTSERLGVEHKILNRKLNEVLARK